MAAMNIYLFDTLDSTNAWMLKQIRQGIDLPALCVANKQTAGRGRRGRQWVSESGRNIYMSLGVRIDRSISQLSALSLVCGLSLVRVLRRLGVSGAGVKWPNDVLVKNQKIAGVLIESAILKPDVSALVIGVGLNIDMQGSVVENSATSWTDLQSELGKNLPDRDSLVREIAGTMQDLIGEYLAGGFGLLQDEWRQNDIFFGKEVMIEENAEIYRGVSQGVSNEGYLLLDTGPEIRLFHVGEISLRPRGL